MTETPSALTSGEPKQAQIVRLVRTAIEAGSLRDGEVLPTTRELAQQWGVSVFTVNEAMRTLAEQGYVVNKTGSKRVARNPNPDQQPVEPRGLDTGESVAGLRNLAAAANQLANALEAHPPAKPQ